MTCQAHALRKGLHRSALENRRSYFAIPLIPFIPLRLVLSELSAQAGICIAGSFPASDPQQNQPYGREPALPCFLREGRALVHVALAHVAVGLFAGLINGLNAVFGKHAGRFVRTIKTLRNCLTGLPLSCSRIPPWVLIRRRRSSRSDRANGEAKEQRPNRPCCPQLAIADRRSHEFTRPRFIRTVASPGHRGILTGKWDVTLCLVS